MKNKLIMELSELDTQRKYILRQIDINYYDKEKRNFCFNKLKSIDNEIKKVKFKLKIEKRIKNDKNSDSNKSNN